MAMNPEESAKWERLRLEVQAEGNTTLQLLGLKYWGDKQNSKGQIQQIVCAELEKRHKENFWIDSDYNRRNGQHPYTQEAIIAEYRRINPL
jgi:hypothetical protein